MSFYFVLLGMHLIVTSVMVWLLVRWAGRYMRSGRRIHYWGYIAPVVLGVVCVLYLVLFTAPFVLDLFRLVNQTYEVGTYEIRTVQGPWVTLTNGDTMLVNPFVTPMVPGQQYQLTFLPRSRFIQSFILLR